jgi:hypothetical protein
MAARLPVSQTAGALLGASRFLLLVAAVLWLPAALSADEDDALARVQALTRGGATQLALRLLDQQQPPAAPSEDWMRWEKERYALYRTQRDWPQLVARVARLSDELPPEFARWARTEAARAELSAGRAEAARRWLRALLWSGQGGRDEQAEWRQLVIRSYLLEDNVADAHTALLRYREDFQANGPAWRLLEATILIRAGQAKAAYALVGDIKTHEGRLLALVAGLRARVLAAAMVLARATTLAEETRNKPALNHQAWALAAEAASAGRDRLRHIYALERALTGAREHAGPERLLQVDADDLWRAYERYAESLGNEARLLVGEDGAWLKQAESYKRDDAMQARAFYAFLVTHGAQGETAGLAARRLADSLIEDGRAEVLRALFTAGSRYPKLQDVPEYVRYRLADQALDDFDIRFAARLMQGLETPPGVEDQERWALRRARVLIYAGDYRTAVPLLSGVLDSDRKPDDAFAERFLQVIFDLQGAGRHIEAIALLETLMRRLDNPRTQREILYWIADSKGALGEHQQAAELYLRSATYRHPTGGDMWGQTARYHAAEALGRAGLTQDARLVYQALLKHTADAKQRAVIERNIQQLWLIENQATTR